MEGFIRKVNNSLGVLSGIALIGLMLMISAGVVTRYIFNFSIPTAYEIIENYLMPITVFSALGYSYFSGIFPRVDAFTEKITSIKIRTVVESVMTFFEFLLFGFVSYYLLQLSIYSIDNKMGFKTNGINFPLYPIHILMFIGFGWMTFLIFYRFLSTIRNKEVVYSNKS